MYNILVAEQSLVIPISVARWFGNTECTGVNNVRLCLPFPKDVRFGDLFCWSGLRDPILKTYVDVFLICLLPHRGSSPSCLPLPNLAVIPSLRFLCCEHALDVILSSILDLASIRALDILLTWEPIMSDPGRAAHGSAEQRSAHRCCHRSRVDPEVGHRGIYALPFKVERRVRVQASS